MGQSFRFQPIGVFFAHEQYPYDAARQAAVAAENRGRVCLEPNCNYEQALADLAGFSRIWLLYWFDRNGAWKPKVKPPRGARKVGVFASRAPYRPNPIGLSCVELVGVEGLTLQVRGHDLLDGTPILDIKPYLPYADSFPEARCGWVDEISVESFGVEIVPEARRQLGWLEDRGAGCVRAFLLQQLEVHPTDSKRKRVCLLEPGLWQIAYRTWRARFCLDDKARCVRVLSIHSGYSAADLADPRDPHGDKALHLLFKELGV